MMVAKWGEAFEEYSLYHEPTNRITVRTMDGDKRVTPSDWIIRGLFGGLYVCKDEEFKLLYEEKVAVVPGGAFGESGKDHVRACYATSMEEIEMAMVRISRFVEKHAI